MSTRSSPVAVSAERGEDSHPLATPLTLDELQQAIDDATGGGGRAVEDRDGGYEGGEGAEYAQPSTRVELRHANSLAGWGVEARAIECSAHRVAGRCAPGKKLMTRT